MLHAAFFYLSSVYRKRSKEYIVSYFFTPLPSILKGERQFDFLRKKLIDKILIYF